MLYLEKLPSKRRDSKRRDSKRILKLIRKLYSSLFKFFLTFITHLSNFVNLVKYSTLKIIESLFIGSGPLGRDIVERTQTSDEWVDLDKC